LIFIKFTEASREKTKWNCACQIKEPDLCNMYIQTRKKEKVAI
jgi:hypothetical protein